MPSTECGGHALPKGSCIERTRPSTCDETLPGSVPIIMSEDLREHDAGAVRCPSRAMPTPLMLQSRTRTPEGPSLCSCTRPLGGPPADLNVFAYGDGGARLGEQPEGVVHPARRLCVVGLMLRTCLATCLSRLQHSDGATDQAVSTCRAQFRGMKLLDSGRMDKHPW